MEYKGIVKAKVIPVRFAVAGKVAKVTKTTNESVSKGELIASLDPKIFQTQLDRELAEYEKVRSDFEIFVQKNPNPTQEIDKYLKKEKQALLNISVKDVELSKANLDLCNMFSPINGLIMDDNGIVPGLCVTPAGSEIKIIDTDSYYVEFEVEQKDIKEFKQTKSASIVIEGVSDELIGQTSKVYSNSKSFIVNVPVTSPDLLLGLSVLVKI